MEDTKAVGTLSQQSHGQAAQDAVAAVAQMLGPGTSALVEIGVKCKGLPDRDVLRCACGSCSCTNARGGCARRPYLLASPCSKSDAMAVLLSSEGYKSKTWSEVARTDTVANSLNPEFRKPLRATYNFEKLQYMRVGSMGAGVGGHSGRPCAALFVLAASHPGIPALPPFLAAAGGV